MWRQLTRYLWLTECAGIELRTSAEGEYECNYCAVSVRKDQLTIDKKAGYSGDISSILRSIRGDLPVALTLTGKGILTKRTSRLSQLSPESIQGIFPDLKAEQFYIQNFISGDHSFISVIRKEVADRLLGLFSNSGFRILTVSLGPFPVDCVTGQLNHYGKEISFDGHVISMDNHIWQDYHYSPGAKNEFVLKIGTEPLPESCLIAYASAFQLLLYRKLLPVELHIDGVRQELSEFKEEKKFKSGLVALLSSAFIVLLTSLVVLNHFNSANKELEARINKSSVDLEHTLSLEKEVRSKETALKKLGWSPGFNYAYICDQLGQSTGPAISFKELSINLIHKNSKAASRKKDNYIPEIIIINGTSSHIAELNSWIKHLRDKAWIKDVRLDSYTPGEDEGSQEFELIMTY